MNSRGYLTGLEPGLRVLNVLDVDGMAWLFNIFSHLEERPPRADVYVMDPEAGEIVDQFNLEHPFPVWAEYGDEGVMFIYHISPGERINGVRYPTGITRLDLETGQERFTAAPEMTNAYGMGVYRNTPCLAVDGGPDTGGLWCMNSDGAFERKLPQQYAVGVGFKEENSQGEPASRWFPVCEPCEPFRKQQEGRGTPARHPAGCSRCRCPWPTADAWRWSRPPASGPAR